MSLGKYLDINLKKPIILRNQQHAALKLHYITTWKIQTNEQESP